MAHPPSRAWTELQRRGQWVGQCMLNARAPVAQLDRASDFESEGRRFDSCRAYHQIKKLQDGTLDQGATWSSSAGDRTCRYYCGLDLRAAGPDPFTISRSPRLWRSGTRPAAKIVWRRPPGPRDESSATPGSWWSLAGGTPESPRAGSPA